MLDIVILNFSSVKYNCDVISDTFRFLTSPPFVDAQKEQLILHPTCVETHKLKPYLYFIKTPSIMLLSCNKYSNFLVSSNFDSKTSSISIGCIECDAFKDSLSFLESWLRSSILLIFLIFIALKIWSARNFFIPNDMTISSISFSCKSFRYIYASFLILVTQNASVLYLTGST